MPATKRRDILPYHGAQPPVHDSLVSSFKNDPVVRALFQSVVVDSERFSHNGWDYYLLYGTITCVIIVNLILAYLGWKWYQKNKVEQQMNGFEIYKEQNADKIPRSLRSDSAKEKYGKIERPQTYYQLDTKTVRSHKARQ